MPLYKKPDGLWYDDCPECVGWIDDEEQEVPPPRPRQEDCGRCEGKGEVQVVPLNFR